MSEQIPVQMISSGRVTAVSSHVKTTAEKKSGIVTRSFSGRFRNRRLLIAASLSLLFFGLSWINWNGRQAVLWDLEERKFYVFGATFWPQDFTLLSAILIVSALGLLAANVFVGRVWCGYTCPQSVWTWAFMWAEKITEGERNQRIKLNAQSWSLHKILKRTAKHSLWIVMSLATGTAFIGYFVPVRELCGDIIQGQWLSASAFWVSMFALATYVNAGWLREQVCLHMCPYARFQSVMFDKDTLVVTYDAARGEQRGARKKEDDPQAAGLGDCVDCYMCVQVCPTGIDIRNGLQIDCIGCAACIDACDTVMDKMGYARGLVGYTSERIQAGEKTKIFRPLVIAYGAAVFITIIALVSVVYGRELVGLNVIKDRSMYRKNNEGDIVNVYRLKVMNKTQQFQHYIVSLNAPDNLSLQRSYSVDLQAGEILDIPVVVAMKSAGDNSGLEKITFSVANETHQNRASSDTTFVYPVYKK